jgi:hypothetical protein
VPDPGLIEPLHELIDRTADPTAADPRALARVRARLMRRIADDVLAQHLTVPGDGGDWRPAGPGLQLKVLHSAGGVMSYLVRLAAGARLPAHRHPVDEECVVLEGQMCIGDLRLGPGGYHLGRQGLPHAELWSETGALIFLRGAPPARELLL